MVSTTSAWCSASRAAQAMASDGVGSATGSRWRGRLCDGCGGGAIIHCSSQRASSPVRPMKNSASATLNSRWKATTCCGTAGRCCSSSVRTCGNHGMTSRQPASLKIRLPTGRRRVAMSERAVVSTPSTPLPTLAPSTRPSATPGGSMPAPASVAVSSTMASDE